ncbi:hypothetical protein ACFP2F_22930 [Hymenobacter artigasi]|uniref:DUF4252 domain-containing protein n=1 Tax=Hymenobacter artigasi TaxID=2719616 RepID=A0ABX1HRI4_9BACT|nr:hypothetical protein [Hymenobacter artigasi]NKI92042.1 hypothetical protein [Hymenobacter artigasi]
MSRLILLAFALFSTTCANGQPVPEKKALIKRFCLSNAYIALNPRANIPAHLRAFVSKALKEQCGKATGPLVFKNKLLHPHESRVMLCSFRQEGTYLFLYQHGIRGRHYHVLYVDQANRVADFYDYQSSSIDCDSVIRTLGEMDVSKEKGALQFDDQEA